MEEQKLQQWLSIGALAARSGVSVAALRFYEDKALIWSVRTEGNQRRYPRYMLRRIAIIKVAQQVGISLSEVKQAFNILPKNKTATKSDWTALSSAWQKILDQKILNMLQLRQQLDWCIGCGCLSLTECPLRNENDQMGSTSSGSHFVPLDIKFDDNQGKIEIHYED
ncbi:redox-sensitive transcriptional activator SoxR [Acinetobacter sp. DSM 11652]|uniref:redox-sensitive transcriptional activator SoxR n=1 Tax=Acinetobacter sp. DSM 11652 TaxID=346222 RepID=UPI0008BF5A99|nr:redox-sensitive transcriptional activator SoxR [Acinetobacter sp. DSM 11652]SEM20673.1 MerR family transcriptional regulator, redox-sensitive transcriptional activator SoxR [Acinetobacter sp. DSM 11652]